MKSPAIKSISTPASRIIHVHTFNIEKGDFKASVALDEEATVLTASKQAGAKDLRMAKTIVKDNLERYREEWIKWRPS